MWPFSHRQAKAGVMFRNVPQQKYVTSTDGPEPMDIGTIQVEVANGRGRSPLKVRCFKCQKLGHIARNCRVSNNRRGSARAGNGQPKPQPKN